MSAIRFYYAYGFKSQGLALDALYDLFASGEVSHGEHPVVKSYVSKGGQRRWGIEIDG